MDFFRAWIVFSLDLFGNSKTNLPIFPKGRVFGQMGKIFGGFRTSLVIYLTILQIFRGGGKIAALSIYERKVQNDLKTDFDRIPQQNRNALIGKSFDNPGGCADSEDPTDSRNHRLLRVQPEYATYSVRAGNLSTSILISTGKKNETAEAVPSLGRVKK